MILLEIIKDMFSSPEASFQKLLQPEYFPNKRAEFDSVEKYTKWLRKIQAEFGSMVFMQRKQGIPVPEKWQEGIAKIEAEIERVKNEFPPQKSSH